MSEYAEHVVIELGDGRVAVSVRVYGEVAAVLTLEPLTVASAPGSVVKDKDGNVPIDYTQPAVSIAVKSLESLAVLEGAIAVMRKKLEEGQAATVQP